MKATEEKYPIVDVFAGPGGLGEGFASLESGNGRSGFHSVASIEEDHFSFSTLHLRHFLRSFPEGVFPAEYYSYLRGGITLEELYVKFPDNKAHADRTALQISLGPDNHNQVRNLISDRLGGNRKWALVGGPPCQAYSLVGRSRMKSNPEFEKDIRHFLYREYLQIITDHAPPVFVMENVKGLLSARVGGELVINRILADLSSPKAALGQYSNSLRYNLYSVSEEELPGIKTEPRHFLVRAEEFGVPQARHRMFIVGVRSDFKVAPKLLKPHKPPTVRQIIENLPSIRSGLSKGDDTFSAWKQVVAGFDPVAVRQQLNGHRHAGDLVDMMASNDTNRQIDLERKSTFYPEIAATNHTVLDEIHDNELDCLDAHESRAHMASDLRRYAFASSYAAVAGRSPKLADFPASLLPEHKNVALGKEGKMFSDRFRVQLPDKVATTITSHISKDGHYFIHYDPIQCRSLTVREAARLQTFPDNYRFLGPRTSQYHQVGNAVPPYLARQIAELIRDVLDRMD